MTSCIDNACCACATGTLQLDNCCELTEAKFVCCNNGSEFEWGREGYVEIGGGIATAGFVFHHDVKVSFLQICNLQYTRCIGVRIYLAVACGVEYVVYDAVATGVEIERSQFAVEARIGDGRRGAHGLVEAWVHGRETHVVGFQSGNTIGIYVLNVDAGVHVATRRKLSYEYARVVIGIGRRLWIVLKTRCSKNGVFIPEETTTIIEVGSSCLFEVGKPVFTQAEVTQVVAAAV